MLKLEFELNQKQSGLTLILLTCHLRILKKPMFWRYSAPVGQSLLSYIKMHTVRKQRSGDAHMRCTTISRNNKLEILL